MKKFGKILGTDSRRLFVSVLIVVTGFAMACKTEEDVPPPIAAAEAQGGVAEE